MGKKTVSLIMLLCFTAIGQLSAEDGSRLWLRFQLQEKTNLPDFSGIQGELSSIALQEFQLAWEEMTGNSLLETDKPTGHTLLIGTLENRLIRRLVDREELHELGPEGYILRSVMQGKDRFTIIASTKENGLLYGAYHLLRLIQTNKYNDTLRITERPRYDIRILNHWDNLNGTVERGYAGYSIWQWDQLPEQISPRYREYARANASVGINGTVLNNVNASPDILTDDYLKKAKVIADILRPYKIKVYLSVNFSSPKILGGIPDSDPLNPRVRQWWQEKAREIYRLIPDFGGFLVKANSEGQPGPQDYGRTHADGANMLADALQPHGGIVMWRAFVYNPTEEDRAKQAYSEFMPLDGQFRKNVVIQVKNGPVDFQPREPFSPLFGSMKQTALMPELQITQEYLGFSNHLVYLATQWKEFLESDTHCNGDHSTVAKTTDGTLYQHPVSAIAGVANIGQDANWCGHHFAQANWYAFGRLTWDHTLPAEEIADEWIRMTFSNRDDFVAPIKQLMLSSWEAAVNYMMPLGLHHIFAWNHHYGPEPWCDIPGARRDWLPPYYHNASEKGIGFDRTTTGSNAVSQYCSPLNGQFNDVNSCPEELLLWFHHAPWSHRMQNGRTLWEELCYRYDDGVQQVREFQKTWDRMEPYLDRERFRHVQSRLRIQSRDAVWWKDACLLYFQTFSRMSIPYDIERPIHELEELKQIKLDLKHHN
ncbi:alpha-glucuronidase family glycosyl hydrolase [Proteiniphilum sp. UBA1028]|jgi:alpha-glucuronidase|uniref:Alpha-glucuronidase n=1 Tax=uncultured organism TaxID=155900 RepID=I7FQ01_9ZZZZ|nr:alpha-glucuronidase family glycosyl hydrolase [Proteiniphilum sp. UBA1028]AFP23143.1 alpha-glucuronidase [uncultured organism]HBG57491.1 alpha-glucuronidase [Porphyromonadaceae bacterium]